MDRHDPDYEIKAYYNIGPDRRLGELAMCTWHIGEHSRDMEISVFLARKDIAYIDVIDFREHKTERRYPSPRS